MQYFLYVINSVHNYFIQIQNHIDKKRKANLIYNSKCEYFYRFLEWSLDENSGIRKQDAFRVFIMVASRDMGFYIAQQFFYKNVKRISD